MQKLIVVCGPTTTGKSDYAVALAQSIGGEILSADSRQVYKGLDIGSGKITQEEMKGIPHHLLDVADPRKPFSVAEYKALADQAIKEILARGNTPILVGGTGFYIDAVITDTLFPAVPPDPVLREALSKKTAQENFKTLQTLDPTRADSIDQHNNIRIIRAIEIASALGSVPPLQKSTPYKIEWHYRDVPDSDLRTRIHARLVARIEAGMLEEIATLHQQGVSWERLESFGLEYRFGAELLQGKRSEETFVQELEQAIWQYAKRQRTWFKKYAQ